METHSPFFFRSPRKGPPRYAIFITPGGRWFLIFTVLVVTVTMTTDNNILYFLSSFLLASVFISSLFSDLAFYRIKVSRLLGTAYSNETPSDVWEIKNPTPFPMMSLELGEFYNQNFRVGLKIPYLGPFQTLKVNPTEVISRRGPHFWDSLYIATAAPFSFSKKFFFLGKNGHRYVWPEKILNSKLLKQIEIKQLGRQHPDFDEIEQGELNSDYKNILALKSDIEAGEIVLRKNREPHSSTTHSIEFDFSKNYTEELLSLASHCLSSSKLRGRTLVKFPRFLKSKQWNSVEILNHLSELPPGVEK